MTEEEQSRELCDQCEEEQKIKEKWDMLPKTKKSKILHYWLGLFTGESSDKWLNKTIEDQKTCNFSDMPIDLILYYKNKVDAVTKGSL